MKSYVQDNSLFVFDIGVPRQYVGAAAYRKDWQTFFATFKGPLKFDITPAISRSLSMAQYRLWP